MTSKGWDSIEMGGQDDEPPEYLVLKCGTVGRDLERQLTFGPPHKRVTGPAAAIVDRGYWMYVKEPVADGEWGGATTFTVSLESFEVAKAAGKALIVDPCAGSRNHIRISEKHVARVVDWATRVLAWQTRVALSGDDAELDALPEHEPIGTCVKCGSPVFTEMGKCGVCNP